MSTKHLRRLADEIEFSWSDEEELNYWRKLDLPALLDRLDKLEAVAEAAEELARALEADVGMVPERYYIPLLNYRNAGKGE